MTQQPDGSRPIGRIALVVAAIAAAFAVGFTISRGTGGDPAGQQDNGQLAAPESIEGLEAATRANPQDARTWKGLGLAYYTAGRYAEAARSYERAAQLAPDDALTWSALGEALVMANERDPMPDGALAAFRRAAAIDPKDPRARYFLAVKRDLDGDHEGAIGDWLALLEDTPETAPWHPNLISTIEQVGKINGIDVSARLAASAAKSPKAPELPAVAQAIPGPTAQDLASASQIPPGEQREMAEGMVERLEGRLKRDPSNVDGWLMLIRSRVTLGEPGKARAALQDAVKANPAREAEIRSQAELVGVR